ncbi:MAG: M28 family peptidase, partial [Candidatus Latescibacteria bacterium]|nr:M28 family peptidase [Candidatus Latescibacterota bacterium]
GEIAPQSALPLSLPTVGEKGGRGDSEGKTPNPESRTPSPIVRLTARIDWESRPAQNLYAFLPGTDPAVADELIVLEAYYDAMSVVPSLAPGAEQACGLAALLELARWLTAHPLKRPVLFMASAGHGEGLAGARAFVARHVRRTDHPLKVALFLALDLSSGSDRLGLLYKGNFYDEDQKYLQPWVAQIGRQATTLAGEIGQALHLDPARLLVDGINPTGGRTWQTYIPGRIALDHEPVVLAGRPGLAFVTVEDARLTVDTPLDTAERVNLDNLTRQTRTLMCLLPDLLNTSAPFVTKRLIDVWGTLSGRVVEFDVSVNILPDKPVPDALVTAASFVTPKTLMGVRAIPMGMTDAAGRFALDGLATVRGVGGLRGLMSVSAFRSHPETGVLVYAPDRGAQGEGSFPTRVRMLSARREATVVVFRCQPVTLFDLIDQRYFFPLQTLAVYDAGTNGQPFIYGHALPQSWDFSQSVEPCAVVFGQPGARLRVTMSSGLAGRQLLLLNATEDDPDGTGFQVDDRPAVVHTAYRVARDMWTLDDDRLRQFARHGIINRQVDRLHRTAKGLLDRAEAALRARRYDEFIASAKAAWSVESRAYPDILGTVEDAVTGVMFYLALLVPFAYCAERLLFAGRRIEWRIIGMFGIFTVVFIILQVVHPAFAITLTPLIVLLAFLIIAMASAVIGIVTMKFEARLAELKTGRTGRHEDDVSRVGSMATAGVLGIANMRNRPFRTALTCLTLVLLTFSVISFTSVIRHLRLNKVAYSEAQPAYAGLLLRHRTWEPLADETYAVFANEFGESGPVAPRTWYYSSRVGDRSFVDVRNPASGATFVATAVVGLTHEEARLRPSLLACLAGGRWFSADDRMGAILPIGVARRLGIDPARLDSARVTIAGRQMPVVGVIDPARWDRSADLDAEALTPVDFVQMSERRARQGPPDPEDFEEYIHLPAENIIFLPYPLVISLGGTLQSIAVGFADARVVAETLDALMPRTALTLFAGTGDRVYLYSTIGATAVGGLSDLVVPILIAALIVMNTMLGSVYERTREIGVFNSVGLAPGHVAALFLAEACVYAVIGVVLGYLIGQSVSRLIIRFDWLPGFELNVSSLAAVGASALVMAVVILSTVYPARLASRIAVPAVEMGWRLPPTPGDRLVIPLPFTVTGSHAIGINAYLKEFLDTHVEAAVGQFACDEVMLSSTPVMSDIDTPYSALYTPHSIGLSLRFIAWLVPYDLGVSQRVELRTIPTDDPHISALEFVIDRLSGDAASWRRVNRNFLNILRKQFLIWRTLGRSGQERYAEVGRAMVGGGADGE